MSTKKTRVRCPKCNRRMSKLSRFEWFGVQAGPVQIPRQQSKWQIICLQCVREHFADPFLHLRRLKANSIRERA